MTSAALKVLSSMAVRDVLEEIVARYARESAGAVAAAAAGGVAAAAAGVVAEAAGGVEVARRVRAGEAVDVVVLARTAIDTLIADGRLVPGSRVDLARSGIAVAVAAGAPRPDVGSEQAVRRAALAARALGYSTGPSGVYLEALFEHWGILETIRSRIVVPPPGIAVGTLVASGAVELGFQQSSELMHVAGVDVVGPLPPAIQHVTTFSGAVGANRARAVAARALLDFMASARVADVKLRHGMEPA
jgi:molybdate transport system substrate-binding protein